MGTSDAETELVSVQRLLRDLRTGAVATARAHLSGGRHEDAAIMVAEVERGLGELEGRIQSFRRRPLFG